MKLTKLNEHLLAASKADSPREVLARRLELMISNRIHLDDLGCIGDYCIRTNEKGVTVVDLMVDRKPEMIKFNLVISPTTSSAVG